ncbi:MAG: hypothetical protein QM736_23385 [Vicinamibacterales bacterium]
MQMLLGLVRVVPDHLRFEAQRVGIVIDAADLDLDDPLEGVEGGAGPQPFHRIRPVRSLAKIHCIVISVREPEAEQQPPRGIEPERVDELLTQESHGRGAQDHDALFVKADDPLIRPEVEQLCQVQVGPAPGLVATGVQRHSACHFTAARR